jgi:RimJ/RimL family protein N-acetyltransferase
VQVLVTERLRLRPITWDDLDFFVALHADPEVARFLGEGRPRSAEETRAVLEGILDGYGVGVGQLAVERLADGALIGRTGLTLYEVERVEAGTPRTTPRAWWGPGAAPAGVAVDAELEVGYALARESWGRGYATEAARAARDHAFRDRDAPRVISLIRPENAASVRVAEKCGLAPRGQVDLWGHRLERYVLERPDWAAGAP